MIAQKEYDEQFGPCIERFLAANGVAFRVTSAGGAAMTDDSADGVFTVACDAIRFPDGSTATLTWGMCNCTHMDWEWIAPQGRSATAYAKLAFRDAAGADAGALVALVRYYERNYHGWSINVWSPLGMMKEDRLHPHAAKFVRRLEIGSSGYRSVRAGQAGLIALAMADFVAKTQL